VQRRTRDRGSVRYCRPCSDARSPEAQPLKIFRSLAERVGYETVQIGRMKAGQSSVIEPSQGVSPDQDSIKGMTSAASTFMSAYSERVSGFGGKAGTHRAPAFVPVD
jgi:hypothetical protein